MGKNADLQPLRELIIAKTEGNPFYMEETVQVLLDEGALMRNGMVKLTKPLGTENSSYGAGDSGFAHRPFTYEREIPFTNAIGHR